MPEASLKPGFSASALWHLGQVTLGRMCRAACSTPPASASPGGRVYTQTCGPAGLAAGRSPLPLAAASGGMSQRGRSCPPFCRHRSCSSLSFPCRTLASGTAHAASWWGAPPEASWGHRCTLRCGVPLKSHVSGPECSLPRALSSDLPCVTRISV